MASCFFLIFIVPSLQKFFVNVNGKYASSIIFPLLAGAVKRRTNMVRARTPPHVQLWVFSKHLQKKCLTLNVIFSIILFMAYGIQIFNTNGTSEILGSNVTGGHLIKSGTETLGSGASVTITVEGMTANNTNTVGLSASAQGLLRPTVSRGSGSFTMTNPYSQTHDFQFFAFRF